jgi:hypothetical protein
LVRGDNYERTRAYRLRVVDGKIEPLGTILGAGDLFLELANRTDVAYTNAGNRESAKMLR